MTPVPQIISALILLTLTSSFSLAQSDKDKEFVLQARQAYYNSKGRGLSGFKARVQPDWDFTIRNIRSNPEALKVLQTLHFTISFENGMARMDHSTDAKELTEDHQQRIKKVAEGVNLIVTGFFATWKLFMFEIPLPPVEGRYRLSRLGENYVLNYNDGQGDVETTLKGDFAVVEMKVSMADSRGSIKPYLVKTDNGFVISGYEGNYEPTASPGKVKLNVRLDHQEVNGYKLPLRLRIEGTYDEVPSQTELLFTQYSVKNR